MNLKSTDNLNIVLSFLDSLDVYCQSYRNKERPSWILDGTCDSIEALKELLDDISKGN
jgi:hypothetical protein